MEGFAQLAHELLIGYGIGRSDDIDTGHGIIAPAKGAKDDVAQIGDVNPGDEMTAGGGVAAEEKSGEAGQRGEDSAGKFRIADDEGNAEDERAEREIGISERFFPCHADIGGEAGADGGRFIENFIAGVAVNVRGAGL
jgi:hypothetical protein